VHHSPQAALQPPEAPPPNSHGCTSRSARACGGIPRQLERSRLSPPASPPTRALPAPAPGGRRRRCPGQPFPGARLPAAPGGVPSPGRRKFFPHPQSGAGAAAGSSPPAGPGAGRAPGTSARPSGPPIQAVAVGDEPVGLHAPTEGAPPPRPPGDLVREEKPVEGRIQFHRRKSRVSTNQVRFPPSFQIYPQPLVPT